VWSESCGILERNGNDPFKFDAELLVKKDNTPKKEQKDNNKENK